MATGVWYEMLNHWLHWRWMTPHECQTCDYVASVVSQEALRDGHS